MGEIFAGMCKNSQADLFATICIRASYNIKGELRRRCKMSNTSGLLVFYKRNCRFFGFKLERAGQRTQNF